MKLALYTNDLLKVRKQGKGRAQNECQEAWWPQNQRLSGDVSRKTSRWGLGSPSVPWRGLSKMVWAVASATPQPLPSAFLPFPQATQAGAGGGRGETQRSCPRDRRSPGA